MNNATSFSSFLSSSAMSPIVSCLDLSHTSVVQQREDADEPLGGGGGCDLQSLSSSWLWPEPEPAPAQDIGKSNDQHRAAVGVPAGSTNEKSMLYVASSSPSVKITAAARPRTVKWMGNERHQSIDHRDDNNNINNINISNSNNQGGNDDDDDDPTTSMMILSRLDIEIQGIGRPRNQSKVRQSLEDDYRDMMRRLTAFINTAKRYHQSLQQMQVAKQKMVRSLEDLARGYPLADAVCTSATTPSNAASTTTTTSTAVTGIAGDTMTTTGTTKTSKTSSGQEQANNSIKSSGANPTNLAQVWGNAEGQAQYVLKFQKQVIRYCTEWQLEVTSRVARAKKETKYLLSRLTHYLKKVERLRLKSPSTSASGTVSSLLLSGESWLSLSAAAAATDPKLERNLGKLRSAWDAHEVKSTQWSYILEQVTLRGWKELHPLLHTIMRLEQDRSASEYELLSQALPAIGTNLDALFDAACKKVPPVVVDYHPLEQQHQRLQLPPNASSSGAAAAMMSSYGSSDDDDWLEEEELEIIEVMLAPRNHYKKELEPSSTSPRGIADIEHF